MMKSTKNILFVLLIVIILPCLIILFDFEWRQTDDADALKNQTTLRGVIDYDGDDWVSQEALVSEIGKSFTSGTDIRYEVISKERNDEAGRERIILQSKNEEKWMILNLPNFYYDVKTETIYFNIYEYKNSEHYIAY